MRYLLVVLGLLACPLNPALAQVSIQIGLPTISIGINVPVYPQLVLVPDYPVYYAPGIDSNYFFYDGMYWVYQGDNWYVSSWYNGPWALVRPEFVPVYILRIPVRYYRQPPAYFRGWGPDAPPRWGEHWGSGWERQHAGWDKWNRQAVPPPAPQPVYQKEYSGNRYPHVEQQRTLHSEHYSYQPREATVQRAYQAHGLRTRATPSERGSDAGPPARGAEQHGAQRGSTTGPPARGVEQHDAQRGNPPSPPAGPGAAGPREQAPRAPDQAQGQQGRGGAPEQEKGRKGKGGAPEPKGDSGQPKGEERGKDRDK
jgi:hypothetical protein